MSINTDSVGGVGSRVKKQSQSLFNNNNKTLERLWLKTKTKPVNHVCFRPLQSTRSRYSLCSCDKSIVVVLV